MSFLQSTVIFPIHTLTSPTRLLTGSMIVVSALAFAMNKLILIA